MKFLNFFKKTNQIHDSKIDRKTLEHKVEQATDTAIKDFSKTLQILAEYDRS